MTISPFYYLVNEYEALQEEADEFYGERNEEMDEEASLMCPCCRSGVIREVQPGLCACSHCGLKVGRTLSQLRNQFSSIYQLHPCPKLLQCELVSSQGLHFSCPYCTFSTLLQ